MAVRDYESSYEAFMSMPESEWLGLLGSLFGGGVLEPEEERAFRQACKDRPKLGEYEDDETTGLAGHADGNGERF